MDETNGLQSYYSGPTSTPLKAFSMLIGGIMALIVLIAGLVATWNLFLAGASFLFMVLLIMAVIAVPVVVVVTLWFLWRAKRHELEHRQRMADLDAEIRAAQLAAVQVEAQVRVRTINFDDQGNAALIDRYGDIVQLRGNMREHPALTSYHYTSKDTRVTEERPVVEALPAPTATAVASLHIPTFRESLDAGLIGPGQAEVLICHELERDEETLQLTGQVSPYRGKLEDNSTIFLGGSSKSGKTTYMAHLASQGALMNALYYVIDPHLTHPEKSLAVKLAALSHAFVLPPAMTDADIHRVLRHAEEEARMRVEGRETRYTGRPIVFIVDEVLAVMERAQRSGNKEIIALYRDLALFMRDLGTQYAKFGMAGIFASQYVTKDAFKLPPPAGNVDFRDGCQSQTLLRLPANQAQAMRLLDRAELRGVRSLPQGHGYMGFYTGDIIRMASGNVTKDDIKYVAGLAAPTPTKLHILGALPTSDLPTSDVDLDTGEQEAQTVSGRTTGPLAQTVEPLARRLPTPEVEASEERENGKYQFTVEEAQRVIDLYKAYRSIDKVLSHMNRGARWHKDASRVLKAAGLIKGEA